MDTWNGTFKGNKDLQRSSLTTRSDQVTFEGNRVAWSATAPKKSRAKKSRTVDCLFGWLSHVEPYPLKNMNQIGSSSQLLGKINSFMFQTTNQIGSECVICVWKSFPQQMKWQADHLVWKEKQKDTDLTHKQIGRVLSIPFSN